MIFVFYIIISDIIYHQKKYEMKLRSILINLLLTIATTSVYAQVDTILVHYWNFNDSSNQTTLVTSSYTVNSTPLVIIPQFTEGSSIGFPPTDNNTGQSFAGTNARQGDDAGSHLRLNLPIGSTLTIPLPTTGYENVVFKYETRRSGMGAGMQSVFYTTNGSSYTHFQDITVVDGTPEVVSLDFSTIAGVNNNANFAIRITFLVGTGSTGGNNRFDNMTLDGTALAGTNVPPVLTSAIPDQFVVPSVLIAQIPIEDYFSDPDGDFITFSASSSNNAIASVDVATTTGEPSETFVLIGGRIAGEAVITVNADDGVNPVVSTTFRVLVYPSAFVLQGNDYAFDSWDANAPEGAFPLNMIFVQSDKDDPELGEPLLFAYAVGNDVAGNIGFPYRNETRTRINGLGNDGISFINTGRGRDVGGAIVALDTRNVEKATLSFLAGTILPNSRTYNLRAMYRYVNDQGTFSDWETFTNQFSSNVEYLRNPNAGHTQSYNGIELPEMILDKKYIQVKFKYYFTGIRLDELSGARDMLRLDNISINDITGISIDDNSLPKRLELAQNYPNPFNPTTRIDYIVPAEAALVDVRLSVFDLLGREIVVLVDGSIQPGAYSVSFDASTLSSGVYIYRIEAGGQFITRKMSLIK